MTILGDEAPLGAGAPDRPSADLYLAAGAAVADQRRAAIAVLSALAAGARHAGTAVAAVAALFAGVAVRGVLRAVVSDLQDRLVVVHHQSTGRVDVLPEEGPVYDAQPGHGDVGGGGVHIPHE